MEGTFKILTDSLLADIFTDMVNKRKGRFKSDFSLRYAVEGSTEYLCLENSQVHLDDICSIGQAVYHSIRVWDSSLLTRIRQRSDLTLAGVPYFEGTNEEREQLNRIDRKLIKTLPADYLDTFLANTKATSRPYDIMVPNGSIFSTFINIDHGTFDVADIYNARFGTAFKILNIIDDDGLNYAGIEAYNPSLFDIFGLGFLISKDDTDKMKALPTGS
jgi:hypothetical protein